jgi:predicted amidohydrolase YtcJ
MFSLAAVRDAMALTFFPAPTWGITSYYDASFLTQNRTLTTEIHQLLVDLDRSGELPVRVVGSHVMRNPAGDPARTVETLRQLHAEVRSEHVSITTLKLFMDGVGPQHTAAMLEDYADEPHRGGFIFDPDTVHRFAEAANLAGFDAHIHACGDAGVRGALDAYERIRTDHPGLDTRNTVCHMEFCHPDDVARFARLDVTANCTPMWGTDYRGEFMDAYPLLVGRQRFERDYCPYGDLVRSGARVTFGADCPGVEVHEIPPLGQIEAAVTRQRPGRRDDLVCHAHQRVEVAHALRAYTIDGARALRLDHLVGSLEVGKRADLVWLGASPFDVAPHDIHAIEVRLTMLSGRPTHGTVG